MQHKISSQPAELIAQKMSEKKPILGVIGTMCLGLVELFSILQPLSAQAQTNSTYTYSPGSTTTLSAQTDSTANRQPTGAYVEGISGSALRTTMNDSVGGVTSATSANVGMQCATGYVLSGGSCVSLASMVPPAPTCAYGQVLSGGSCVPVTSFTPPTCPTGQVLSGGACVPIATPACPTSPSTSQTISCPSGQAGGIIQTRTGTCNSSTAYSWVMGSWTTTSNTCSPVPTPTPTYSSCITQTVSWGSGCVATASAGAHGTSRTVSDTLPSGSATFTCNDGSWSYSSGSCTTAPAPTCPPSPNISQTVSCPTGQTGSETQTRTATCNSSTGYAWVVGSWSTVSNSCVATPTCPPAPSTSQTVSCPTGQTGSETQTRTARCNWTTGYSWEVGSWTTSSSSCVTTPTCPPAPDTSQTISCPAGQTGSETQTRTATCNSITGYSWVLGPWTTSINTCLPLTPPTPEATIDPYAWLWDFGGIDSFNATAGFAGFAGFGGFGGFGW